MTDTVSWLFGQIKFLSLFILGGRDKERAVLILGSPLKLSISGSVEVFMPMGS
jgi:hypothetical protein